MAQNTWDNNRIIEIHTLAFIDFLYIATFLKTIVFRTLKI